LPTKRSDLRCFERGIITKSSYQNQFYSQISKASELFSMIINSIDYSEYRFEEAILCCGIGSKIILELYHLGGVSINRRSRNDIAVDILRVSMNGAKKTHIVYGANLNFNITHKYLEMLKEKELIRHENGLFITTDKGKVFQAMAKEFKL
jgi:predicted transcriptional regulator